MADDGLDN